MLPKILIVIALIAMIGSLFSAMFFMFKDKGGGTRTVKALTIRVSIWIALFALIVIGLYTGTLKPSNSLLPANQNIPSKSSASQQR